MISGKSISHIYRSLSLAALIGLFGLLNLPSAAGSSLLIPTQNVYGQNNQAGTYDSRFGFTVTANPSPDALDAELALLGGEQSWYSYDPDQPASASPTMNRPSPDRPKQPASPGPQLASASATMNRVYQVRTGDYYALAGGQSGVTALQNKVDAAPRGSYWLIGNEPNVIGQDSVSPQNYATQYEAIKNAIRQVDPTAKMVGGNFMNWNTTCLACNGFPRADSWVPQMMEAYRQQTGHEIDFDIWGFHTYNINWEKFPMVDYGHDINQISSFRTYLNTLRDQAAKPIWLTEFGVIWGYSGVNYYQDSQGNWRLDPVEPFQRQAMLSYLKNYLDWLLANAEAKNIGRWFLFTNYGQPDAYSDAYGGISLFDDVLPSSPLTDFGILYRDKSQTTPLAAPSQLELQLQPVSDSNQTNVRLSWLDNTTTENGFYVERRTGTVGDWSQIATLDTNSTAYQDNGLDPSSIYYYRVQAFNNSDKSHYSVEASILPALGTLQVTSVSASQVNLSWVNPAAYSGSAVNFVVEYRVGMDGNWNQLVTLPPGTTTYTHTSPATDTLYFYRVRAYNNQVSSPYTNLASAVTPGPPELTVTELGDNGQANTLHSLSYALDWATNNTPKTVILALPAGQTTITFELDSLLPVIPPGVTIAGKCGANGAYYNLNFSKASNRMAGLSLHDGVTFFGIAITGTNLKATNSRNWLACTSIKAGGS